MNSSDIGGNNMYVGYQPDPCHTDRILDTGMIIDHIFLGQDMDDPLIFRNLHGLCRVDHFLNIHLFDFPVVNG